MKKWALLRSRQEIERYNAILETRKPNDSDFFLSQSKILKDFTYWKIIENTFPYDAIAKVHHLLLLKRKAQGWSDILQKEYQELLHLRDIYLPNTYEVILENMPKQKTIPESFHLHLLVLKRVEL